MSGQTVVRSKTLQQVLDAGFAGDNTHFDVIHEDNNWIVCYPKTYKASISLARMGPDKQYYTPAKDFLIVGKMNWCTSVDSPSNMFLNYHRAMNLHMYYLTRKTGFNPNDKYRKMCVSFAKEGKTITLMKSNASVDGDNSNIEHAAIVKNVGQHILDIMTRDVARDERLEISLEDYYRSLSVTQVKSILKLLRDGDNYNDYKQHAYDIEEISILTENPKILILISRVKIEMSILKLGTLYQVSKHMLKNKASPTEAINNICEANKDEPDNLYLATRHANTSAETLDLLSRHKDIDIRDGVARNQNASDETLTRLINFDNSWEVREIAKTTINSER